MIKELLINKTPYVKIKIGDLFKQEGIKIIPVNESFDTTVDEVIVSSKTLHGIFLNKVIKHYPKVEQYIQDYLLNPHIDNFSHYDKVREKTCYKLGTSIPMLLNSDYILVALSRFDKNHKAYLNKGDYEDCMRRMWQVVFYQARHNNLDINIPIMGSGVTQLNEELIREDITEQYAVLINKMMEYAYEYGMHGCYHETNINIIIHDSIAPKIDFNKLDSLTEHIL